MKKNQFPENLCESALKKQTAESFFSAIVLHRKWLKTLVCILALFVQGHISAQTKKAEDFGFRHLQVVYKGDTVDILLKSKKGDEQKKKPVFLFCQGSLPQPLIKYDDMGAFGVFPFRTDSLASDFHLVIIGKPYIPLISETKALGNDMSYHDPSTGKAPQKYSERNYLDYYVNRNLEVITYLLQQQFVDGKKLIVAGHSEGSTIAAKLASVSKDVTHLIYASGNPLGRIMTMIGKDRKNETDTDSTRFAESQFEYWKEVVENKSSLDDTNGDTPKATYDFSLPPIEYLKQLKIPVLVCYGTNDYSSTGNDYLRVEMIREQRTNFTFKAYIGLEHNFFPLTETGKVDYDQFNWNKVADGWRTWINQ
ncbi:MAG: alpha/beta hydrolase family protein [Bacteroidia bacterium]